MQCPNELFDSTTQQLQPGLGPAEEPNLRAGWLIQELRGSLLFPHFRSPACSHHHLSFLFPYARATERLKTGAFPLGCVPWVCLGSVFPCCQNRERREQDPGQDWGKKQELFLHRVPSSLCLLYLRAPSRDRIPSSACFHIAKMFVRVFPAVLPDVLTDGWLHPSSIFSTVASEALGFERILLLRLLAFQALCVLSSCDWSSLSLRRSATRWSLLWEDGDGPFSLCSQHTTGL